MFHYGMTSAPLKSNLMDKWHVRKLTTQTNLVYSLEIQNMARECASIKTQKKSFHISKMESALSGFTWKKELI